MPRKSHRRRRYRPPRIPDYIPKTSPGRIIDGKYIRDPEDECEQRKIKTALAGRLMPAVEMIVKEESEKWKK